MKNATSKFARPALLAGFAAALVVLAGADGVQAAPSYAETVSAKSPVAYWRFSELGDPAAGTLTAVDSAGAFTATYGAAARNGFNAIAGPQPPVFSGLEATNAGLQPTPYVDQSWVTAPALNLNTNTVTFTMWIYPTGGDVTGQGLFINRGGGTGGAGIGMEEINGLYYTWNNNSSATYTWHPGLIPPANTWSFVALVIEPAQATMYLCYVDSVSGATNILSAVNVLSHRAEPFAATSRIGSDTYLDRTFGGTMDEVAVFNRSLLVEDISQLLAAGLGDPAVVIPGIAPAIGTQPVSQQIAGGQTAQLTVGAGGSSPLSYQWQGRALGSAAAFTNLSNGGTISGATTASLTVSNMSAANVADYQVLVANPYGSVTSSIVKLESSPVFQISLNNASFEFPTVTNANGWWDIALPPPSSFGWSNNLGTYVLTMGSSHFSSANDGFQALSMNQNQWISQDLAPTAANTRYTLSFSQLQDNYTPNPLATVKAEIFDGTNLLASSNFTVPETPNTWATNTLVAISPATPVGRLIVKFTGVYTGSWIDKVSLTAAASPITVVGLQNASFETPAIAGGGWYVGTELTNLTFFPGWSNNLSGYCFAGKGAGHFSAAGDGAQALLLGSGKYILQNTGPTAADKFYKLSFSLLQSAYTANPSSTLRAEIFDGTNLLSGGSFTVPSAQNSWQTFNLTAFSPHSPTGALSIKFTGAIGGPWLDKVSLAMAACPSGSPLTNGSFELPTVNSGSWYVVPSDGMSASFGWSNTFTPGGYIIATGAGHFSTPADGSQALLLGASTYISQDAGATVADTLYYLNVNILQSKSPPYNNPNAAVQAQIFDGATLLASNTVTVPYMTNSWQPFTLTATSPHVPSGRLIVKLGGNTAACWVDKVSLASVGLYAAPAAPPLLSIQPAGAGQVTVTWSQGTLIEATDLSGPWTTNNQVSPYTFTPTGPGKFFRAMAQ